MVKYLHDIPAKIPTVCTSLVTSVNAPISASSIPSVNLFNNKHQVIPAKFPSTNYGKKFPVEIIAKIPDNVTLALHNVKVMEKTPATFLLGELSWLSSCQDEIMDEIPRL